MVGQPDKQPVQPSHPAGNLPPGTTPRGMQAARLALLLATMMQAYDGLSSILLPFLGDTFFSLGAAAWAVLTGASQLLAAVVALMQASRRNLRGATLAVAACILLGWLTTVPAIVQHGLDVRADARLTSAFFVVSPAIAVVAAAIAWRASHPILAALIVSAPALVGLLFVIALTASIALYGM